MGCRGPPIQRAFSIANIDPRSAFQQMEPVQIRVLLLQVDHHVEKLDDVTPSQHTRDPHPGAYSTKSYKYLLLFFTHLLLFTNIYGTRFLKTFCVNFFERFL
jgi:hypothetical protein